MNVPIMSSCRHPGRNLWLAMCLAASLAATGAATITRGPYLQQGTPSSVILRWRTDVATASFVRFGTAPGVFTTTVSDAASVTDHVLAITDLLADTRYYYEVGTATGWFAGDANDFFATSPLTGTARPTRLWVLGDSGTANASAGAVRDAYLSYAAARPADLLLMLGDNAYNSGTDAEYQTAVFNFYPTVLQNTVLWPTIGNHDTASSPTPPANLPYFNMFSLPQNGEVGGVPSGTEKYYSFDYGQIHFICLDSMSSDRSSNGPMLTWLTADMQANLQPWTIAFWHHPPYTKGSHNSDTATELIQMRQNYLPTLESFGVDLVLCGHSHSYERSFLIDGHYGTSDTFAQAHKKDGGDGREDGTGVYVKPAAIASHQGAVYVVAGSSGQIAGGTLNHPAMLVSLNQLGSLVIDINDNRLDCAFLKSDALIGDYFTIVKAAPPSNPPTAPGGLAAVAASSSAINLTWTDNSTDEDGFKVERSLNGIDFTQISVIGANVSNGLDTGLDPQTTYYYRVRAHNIAGDSPYSNIAQATTPAGPVVTTLIASNSVWKYRDNGTDQGTAWRAAAFNDSAWASGPAELGYGDGGEATMVSFGPNSSAKYITTYFRKSFTVADLTPYTNLLLQIVRDDGAVVYLNGVEIYRVNLPTGTIAFNTLAPVAIGGADESTYLSANLSPAALVAGDNVIAVEMHQNAGTSSDVSFNLQLTAQGVVIAPDTEAPAAVSNLIAANATPNSITLAWTAPGDDGNTGAAASYDVRASTAPITEANWDAATPVTGEQAPGVAGTPQNLTVLGLNADTTYYFALKTSDETNNVSLISNVASASTLPPPDVTAPAAVADLAVYSVTTDSATLIWTAPGDDDASGTAAAYDVRFSTSPITEANWGSATPVSGEPVPGVAGTPENLIVSGLSSGTTYYFAVKAADEANNLSPLSNVANGTTVAVPDVTAPNAVANLVVSSVTSNSATLTWTAPGDDGASGTAASYDLRYSTAPITEANWDSATPVAGAPSPALAGSPQNFTVTGLSAGTTYYFALKASDEINNVSPISNVPLATTAGVPVPWLTRDIGAVAAAGSASHTNGVFTVRGSGADIAGSQDEFRFVYQSASGDCDIIARVAAVQNTHKFAKAAVMIRETLNANSTHATMALMSGDGLKYLYRTSTGGGTSSSSGGKGIAPYWVRLVRVGNNFTAYQSTNGTTWTTVNTRTITMGANVFIGLAVTSRADGTLNTSRFDSVSVTP